jgi:hypothetical protein
MPIIPELGKKRKIQSGRNFVFTQAQQRQFDAMLQQQRLNQLTARGKRIRSNAKEIVDRCILQTKRDMRDNHKWSAERHSNELTRRIQHEVVKRIPLPKEERALFDDVINLDTQINNLCGAMKSGKRSSKKEMVDLFKRSRQIFFGLGPKLQKQFPNEFGEVLEKLIGHLQKPGHAGIGFNKAFVESLRFANSARITKEHGVEYTLFINEISAHILKNVN